MVKAGGDGASDGGDGIVGARIVVCGDGVALLHLRYSLFKLETLTT